MDRLERERRILQQVIGIGALVPFAAGLWGVLFGAGLTGDQLGLAGDSHYRYLSGLLLGIALLFWSSIPTIEEKAGRIQVLTLVVVIGGLGRLSGLLLVSVPTPSMLAALVMELAVTPALCLWAMRIARAFRSSSSASISR